MSYEYQNIPLTPSIAQPLIVELLQNSGTPLPRADIVGKVDQRHKELGGAPSEGDLVGCVKKALANLKRDDRASSITGRWKLADEEKDVPNSVETVVIDEDEPAADDPLVQNEIGSGSGTIYVYYSENDKTLADLKGNRVWECKIGRTDGRPSHRIMGQGVRTAMARMPVIGLAIRHDRNKFIERYIHFVLDEAERRVPDALGDEWFYTNPEEVSNIFRQLETTIEATSR